MIRAALAATLSRSMGHLQRLRAVRGDAAAGRGGVPRTPRSTSIKVWDWDRPGNIKDFIAQLNAIRRANPALWMDIVTTNAGVRILLNDGSGGFTTGWADMTYFADTLAVADFNGDGFTDLLGSQGGWLKFAFGDGLGGFSVGTGFELGSLMINSLATGDFNGDGKPDLAVLDSARGTVSIVFGYGDGTFSTPASFTIGGFPIRPLVLADLNGDGRPDLVVVDSVTQEQVVLLCNQDGTLRPAVRYPLSQVSATVGQMVVGDFDGDGIPDLLAVPFGSDTTDLEFRLGSGDGAFHDPVRVPACQGIRSAAAGDFNGDGRLDLVLAGDYCATRVLLNSCGPAPAPRRSLAVRRAGTGSGTVVSDLSGISCGATCGAWFPSGRVVTLAAAPDAGSYFGGWSGEGCSGRGTCKVTMDQTRNVMAIFLDSARRLRRHLGR